MRRAARFDFRTCARSFLRLSFYRYPGLRQFACFALSCRQRKGAGLGDTLGRELGLSDRLRLLFRGEALRRGLICARRFFGAPRYRVQQSLIQIQALPKDRLCVTLGFAALPRLRLGSLFFPYALARLGRGLPLRLQLPLHLGRTFEGRIFDRLARALRGSCAQLVFGRIAPRGLTLRPAFRPRLLCRAGAVGRRGRAFRRSDGRRRGSPRLQFLAFALGVFQVIEQAAHASPLAAAGLGLRRKFE